VQLKLYTTLLEKLLQQVKAKPVEAALRQGVQGRAEAVAAIRLIFATHDLLFVKFLNFGFLEMGRLWRPMLTL
jgi:hypothetical protein